MSFPTQQIGSTRCCEDAERRVTSHTAKGRINLPEEQFGKSQNRTPRVLSMTTNPSPRCVYPRETPTPSPRNHIALMLSLRGKQEENNLNAHQLKNR